MDEENIKQKIAQKFQKILPLNKVDGVQAVFELRIDDFSKRSTNFVLQKFDDSWLKHDVYQVYAGRSSVVISMDSEGEPLWLDDHRDNNDFKKFFVLEQLFMRLHDDPKRIADLITRVKFGDFLLAKLVESYEEIPVVENVSLSFDYESLIKPVQFRTNQLEFFVWTRKVGILYEVNMTTPASQEMDFSAQILAIGVGSYMGPF